MKLTEQKGNSEDRSIASPASNSKSSLRMTIVQGVLIFLLSLYIQSKGMEILSQELGFQSVFDSFFVDKEAQAAEAAAAERRAVIERDNQEVEAWDDDAFRAQYTCDPNHNYRMKLLSHDPMIWHIENFLAPGEADHLRFVGKPRIYRSMAGGRVSKYRTSATTFFDQGEDPVMSCIEARASNMTNVPLENFEGLQVVRYRPGQYYQSHHDFKFTDAEEKHVKSGGPRIITIFAYLNSVDPVAHGGSTIFTHMNKTVPAVKNSAVFWYNEASNGELDGRLMHQGDIVRGAVKWGLNIWIRKYRFNPLARVE